MTTTVAASTTEKSQSLAQRAGVFFTLLATTTFGSGCASVMRNAPPVDGQQAARVAPFDPVAAAREQQRKAVLREVDAAQQVARKLGMENFVYIDSKRELHSTFQNVSSLVGNNGGFQSIEAIVQEKDRSLTFSMKAFTEWREAQAQDVLARPKVRELLERPGSGVLLSIDGQGAVVMASGAHVPVAPVQPFIAHTGQP